MATTAPPASSPQSSARGPSGGGAASKAFLLAAVVMGVLATVLAFGFINSTAGTDRGPKTTIVVAKHDLRPNATLDPDRDLLAEEVPSKFAKFAATSLNWESRSNYKGQRLNRRVSAGQPVFLGDFSVISDIELKENQRALTIPAEPGIIIPGDYVKIIVPRADLAALPPPPGGQPVDPARGQFQAALIGNGPGYRVIAVGGNLFKTRQQVTAADQYESSGGSAKTVTLEVDEKQALDIQRALGNGQQRVTLLLCPPPATAPAN